MTILMLIPVWKRPEILQRFVYNMQNCIPDYCGLRPVFILSKEDPDFEQNRWITRLYDYFIWDNFPLGAKLNAAFNHCKQYDWDYMMNMGSDNIYTYRLWELYETEFIDGADFFGINDCYFYDIVNERAKYIKGYNTGVDSNAAPFGAGRCIARSLLNDIDKLWRDEWQHGLDGCSAFTLYQKGYLPKVVETHGEPVMLDIKTATNLTNWAELEGEPVDVDYIKTMFNLIDSELIGGETIELLSKDGFRTAVCKLTQQLPTQQDAFNIVNEKYRQSFGERKYKSYGSYRSSISNK